MISECLESVIGLSKSECDCLEVNDIESTGIDPVASLSGLYMDNLQHGIPLQLKPDCGKGSIWELLDEARSEESKDFVTRLQMKLYQFRKAKYSSMFSFFGEKTKKGNSSRTGLKQFAGLTLSPLCDYKYMQLCVNSISLGINTAGTYAVEVIRIGDMESEGFYNVEVGSDGFGTLKQEMILPLSDKYGNPICYSFVYDRMGALPKDYKFHCGCTSVSQPEWMDKKTLSVGGFSVNDPSDIEIGKTGSKYSNGLIIDFTISCPAMNWICEVKPSF